MSNRRHVKKIVKKINACMGNGERRRRRKIEQSFEGERKTKKKIKIKK